MPDKKIGDSSFIFKVNLDLFQSLQKINELFVSLVSENKHKRFNDALKEIGNCRQAITTRRIAINDDLVVDEFLFFWDSLFIEV